MTNTSFQEGCFNAQDTLFAIPQCIQETILNLICLIVDGSLESGIEIVSHPMSLDYHCNEMPLAQVLEEARSLRYRSHGAGTCGLHVHVSRRAFGDVEAQQEACIARILYFFEKHWEELLKFSRRSLRQLERWAARYGYKEQPMEIPQPRQERHSRRPLHLC